MLGLNDEWFVFYWRPSKSVEWLVSQPITMGEIIEGDVELELSDGGSLPLNDVNWGVDFIMYASVPSRDKTDENKVETPEERKKRDNDD